MDKNTINKWFEWKLTEWDGKIQELSGRWKQTSAEMEMQAEYEKKKAELKRKWADANDLTAREKFKLNAESRFNDLESKIKKFRAKNM